MKETQETDCHVWVRGTGERPKCRQFMEFIANQQYKQKLTGSSGKGEKSNSTKSTIDTNEKHGTETQHTMHNAGPGSNATWE